jgi:hypothetical protein
MVATARSHQAKIILLKGSDELRYSISLLYSM